MFDVLLMKNISTTNDAKYIKNNSENLKNI